MDTREYAEGDPRYHASVTQNKLRELISHLREDVSKVNDPKAKALFETAAEVLTGLKTAFKHYEQKSEEAWRG